MLIITKLIGGLGNQMFQYAIARSIAHTRKADLKIDISGFELTGPQCTPRRYELNHFSIVENFANNKETQRFIGKKARLLTFFGKTLPILENYTYHYYIEKKNFNYDQDVFESKGNIYLDGYWQTEKYFKNIKDVIKNDFTIKTKQDEKNNSLLKKIKNCDAVAVHVRRGDYVTSPLASSICGTCSLDYYKKGVGIIVKRVHEPHFFIFSDDPEWAKKNLKIDFPTVYVTHNGADKGYEDMRLMSNCKHFVIANSSFSWWGAWLSCNPNKIILAPRKWFKKGDVDTKDLIPKGWTRI